MALTTMNARFLFFLSRRVMPAIAALLFVLVASPGQSASGDALPAPAPKWTLTDLAGHTVGSETLKGKVVVLDFWATWCVPCLSEIPGYVELQKKYGGDGLVVVGVSVDQKKPEAVAKFAHAKGINYTVAMADEEIADAFGGVEAIPTTFLIDRKGQIVHRKVGAVSHEEYEKLVVNALR